MKYTKINSYITILLLLISNISIAQLDIEHYLPPIKTSGDNSSGSFQHSEVVLSTPSSTSISVEVYLGTSLTQISGSPFSVTKGSPYTMSLTDFLNEISLSDLETGIINSNKGFYFKSTDKFIVTYKARSGNNNQADAFTCKGISGSGTSFKWGGFPNNTAHGDKNAYLSIMATQDNTNIKIKDYDPNCVFRLGANNSGITLDSIVETLNRGETYVLECKASVVTANINGFIGASISSDKPIVVNNGHGLGGNTNADSRDLMLEQSIPVVALGNNYIGIRGNSNGPTKQTDQLIVIATENSTDVYVNGNAVPIASNLNEGDYFIIEGNNFTAGGDRNMFIRSTKPVYCYQQILGGTDVNTTGLNLIPTIDNCLPNEVVEIPAIEDIAGFNYNGGVILFTKVGAVVTINGATIPSADFKPLTGNLDWITYKSGSLTGNISIVSTESMAAGILTHDGNAGIAGFYSGFGAIPEIVGSNSLINDEFTCPDSLAIFNDVFDGYQWLFNSVPISSSIDFFHNVTTEGFFSLETTYNGCIDTSNTVEIKCTTLGLEINNFKVDYVEKESEAFLKWNSINNKIIKFHIERSTNDYTWEEIGHLNNFNKGNSVFSYTDNKLKNELELFYRVKGVNTKGEISYSEIRKLNLSEKNKRLLVYPNPSNGKMTILNINEKITFLNILGEEIKIDQNITDKGVEIDFSMLNKGVYYIFYNQKYEKVIKN